MLQHKKIHVVAQAFFVLISVAGLPAAGFCSPDAKAEKYPLPVYNSKPVKYGLFPEELISAKDLREMQELKGTVVIFDARGKTDYDLAHIQGAVLPLSAGFYEKEALYHKGLAKNRPDREIDLKESMKKYPKNTPIVTYCNVDCQASAVLLIQLKQQGFTDVRAMGEGFQVWQKAGYPVEPPPAA